MSYTAETLPEGRRRLAQLTKAGGDIIRIEDAARILDLDGASAAKMLARWTNQGWLRRVSRGAYAVASLDSLESEHVLSDPWILAPVLFDPCYIGGRTAAEHWDLTEQIFNDIVIFTAQRFRTKSAKKHGITFTLKHIDDSKLFGMTAVWRDHTKVMVSDPHRTVIDMLDDPAGGGGIRHVADCLAQYFRRDDHDARKLIDYAERLGNGAVFKRLGFLIENEPERQALADACLERLTKGNAKLDPALDCPRLATRWKLWVPEFWSRNSA